MKIFFITALYNCVFINIYAQPAFDDSILAKIKNVGYLQSQVKQMTYELADVYGQRLTGSREYLTAAKWASTKMKATGLANVHFENFCTDCIGWNVKSFNVEMQFPNYMHIVAYPLAWTKSTKGVVEGDVVNIESFADINLLKQEYAGKLKGKIILLGKELQLNPLPDTVFKRFTKAQLEEMQERLVPQVKVTPLPKQLEIWHDEYFEDNDFLQFVENEGAIAVLKTSSTVVGIMNVAGTYYYKANDPKPLPYFIIMPEHAGRLIRLIKQNITPRIKLNLETILYNEPDNNVNIIGEITGSDAKLKSEVVLIGGHFDSWHTATGATDNGGNCMVLLEALRILKESGMASKRTIRLAFWGGEEEDFNGSISYATKHYGDLKSKPNSESEKVTAYLNLDNGLGAIRGVYLQGNEFARPVFEDIFRRFSSTEQRYTIIENKLNNDHVTFDYYNIPSVQFIQDPLNYRPVTHHTPLDLPEYAPEPDMMKNAVMLAWTIYSLASSEKMVPRKMKN
ncbi:MAG: M20/M25/M40 family metallo-hydrolase [Chitinophagaceae bacterium]